MKRKRKVKSFQTVLAFMLSLCLAMAMNVTVLAADDATPAVATAREGVVQIKLVYVDSAGNEETLKTGSGFLVGAGSGATTVITNYHVVSLTDDQKAACSNKYGVDFFNANSINLQIQIVVKRDVVISASYVNGSEKTDFAILELSQAIYDRSPLKLAYSDQVVETQRVYALGFPWTASAVADDQIYTSQDVTITNGIVGKFQTIDEISFILHDAAISDGNSGGPLVDSDGYVVGVNTAYAGTDAASYYYSIAIDEIAEVMDALGIVYERADAGSGSAETASVESVQATTEQESTAEQASAETQEAVPTSESVPASAPVLEEETESSAVNMPLMIGIAAAIIIVILVIVVVAVAAGSKKKKAAPAVPPVMGGMPNGMAGAAHTPGQTPGMQTMPRPTPPPFQGGSTPFDSGAGETSVLGGGAGETSVLSANMQHTATLIRRKNGETVTITKALFSIGKERSKVDFCIPDNNSISRNHANIICRDGVYYIVDKNSTNYTFVNGSKVSPNQEVKLNSGDKIKLADEEFEFRL